MAVTFVVANSRKEIVADSPWVSFPDHLHDFLYLRRDVLPPEVLILVDLDPYDLEVLKGEQITRLMEACHILLSQKDLLEIQKQTAPSEDDMEERNLEDFLPQLIELCQLCQQTGTNLISSGD